MSTLFSIVWMLGWIGVAIFCEAKVAWIYNEKSYGWKFAKQMLLSFIYNVIGCIILDVATMLWGAHGTGLY